MVEPLCGGVSSDLFSQTRPTKHHSDFFLFLTAQTRSPGCGNAVIQWNVLLGHRGEIWFHHRECSDILSRTHFPNHDAGRADNVISQLFVCTATQRQVWSLAATNQQFASQLFLHADQPAVRLHLCARRPNALPMTDRRIHGCRSHRFQVSPARTRTRVKDDSGSAIYSFWAALQVLHTQAHACRQGRRRSLANCPPQTNYFPPVPFPRRLPPMHSQGCRCKQKHMKEQRST